MAGGDGIPSPARSRKAGTAFAPRGDRLMDMEPQPFTGIEALLAHRTWVRDLARMLVADGSAAEDLEQQVWMEAIASPPRHGGSLRAWLGRVLRRRAADGRRERWRRARRETAAARPEAQRPTAEVVAEAEAHRAVADAVLSLEEPYRETVLLRFFEGMSPAGIASRQGVPVETVRTRTRRALDRLREALDRRSGGDRGAWVAALVPLVGFRAGEGAAAAATGGIVMASKATVVAGVAGAIVATGAVLGVEALSPAASTRDLEEARAEVRELRGRLEAVESRPAPQAPASPPLPAPAPGPDPAVRDRLASQDRRIAALEKSLADVKERAAAGPGDAARDGETAAQREEREARAREGREQLERAKRAVEELESQVAALRKRALDRSLAESDRLVALGKLRFLPKGIDREVVAGMIAFFRESTEPATRDAILRELHGTKDPELKALFLDALRTDEDEKVRERAARDIDTWLDDREVRTALQDARDSDASPRVRQAAGRTLQSKVKEDGK